MCVLFQFTKRNDNPSRITDEQSQHVERHMGTSRIKEQVGGGGWVTCKVRNSISCWEKSEPNY